MFALCVVKETIFYFVINSDRRIFLFKFLETLLKMYSKLMLKRFQINGIIILLCSGIF